MFFFFKQKTAYEVRISDWSSDVCSSDLVPDAGHGTAGDHHRRHLPLDYPLLHSHGDLADHHHGVPRDRPVAAEPVYGKMKAMRRRDSGFQSTDQAINQPGSSQIGRASGRERVWQYVKISGVAVSLKKKTKTKKKYTK